MSKILRRPMFRGGRVDSRGTGITSGLMNGGRVGYNIGGAVSNWFSRIAGQAPKGATGPASINTATTTGGQLLESARPMQGPNISPFQQAMEDRLKPKLVTGRTIGQRLLDMGGRFVGGNPALSMIGATAAAFAPVAGLAAANAPETIEELQIMKQYGPVDETWTEDMIQQYEADRAEARKTGTPLGTGETGITSSDEELQKVLESQVKKPTTSLEQKTDDVTQKVVDTEEPELTVDDYIDLLGGKKAMRRDVGDMLGRASAAFLKRPARGETRGITDALGDFMAAEVAAGPGRREKIEQTAAMLDIKDKQATKRAKEQVELFKGQEDYRSKLATARAKGTIDDQYLVAKKTEGKPAATAIAIRNSLPGYQNREFEVVEEKEAKNRQITENDIGKVIIQGNKNGTYTAKEIIKKPDGTIGINILYTAQ